MNHHLERDNAKACLHDLVLKVADTIQKLHLHGYAHLDVRLENICFRCEDDKKTCIVVLIDLDTLQEVDKRPFNVSTESRMGCKPKGKDNTYLDWTQLGMLAAYVLCHPTSITNRQYHSKKYAFPLEMNDYPAVQKLLTEGMSHLIVCVPKQSA